MSFSRQDQVDDARWESRFAAIETEAAAILEREGKSHVRGVFYPSEDDATMARMIVAEGRVAERDRLMMEYWERGRVHGSRT